MIEGVSMDVPEHEITAIIGPSGAGKSTMLRCINRMNDLVDSFRMEGEIRFKGYNLYAPESDPTQIRYQIGMVFQRPNPFPKSIYENVAFGPRINGYAGRLDDIVEESLRNAALWDEISMAFSLKPDHNDLENGSRIHKTVRFTLKPAGEQYQHGEIPLNVTAVAIANRTAGSEAITENPHTIRVTAMPNKRAAPAHLYRNAYR